MALSSELVWEDFELIHEADDGSCSSIAVFEGNDEAIAISGKATLSLLFWIEPAVAADAGLIAIQSGFTEISLFMEKPREGDASENAESSEWGMDTVRPASPFFLGDSLPSTLSTRFSTRQPFTGLTVNKSMLAVFSTQLVTVFKVTEDQGSLLACPVSCIETLGVTGAVAYFDGSATTLFVATPRGVLLMSLERHAMDPVCPHSPAPKHIWLKGDTLGVMSTDNCISVWRLGKGAPALLSTEKVEASCAQADAMVVKSITGAKDGSRISFILQRRKQKNYRPHSAQNLTLNERGNLPVPLAEDSSADYVTEENAEEALGIFDVSTANFRIYGLEILRGTKVTFHQWDERDVRLLVCCVWRPENRTVANPMKDKRGSPRLRQMNCRSRPYIVTFFIDHDGRLAEQFVPGGFRAEGTGLSTPEDSKREIRKPPSDSDTSTTSRPVFEFCPQECIPTCVGLVEANSASASPRWDLTDSLTSSGSPEDSSVDGSSEYLPTRNVQLVPICVDTPCFVFVYFETVSGHSRSSSDVSKERSAAGVQPETLETYSWIQSPRKDDQGQKRKSSLIDDNMKAEPASSDRINLRVTQHPPCPRLVKRLMSDFRCSNHKALTEEVISSVMDFSYHLAFNNVGKAYQALSLTTRSKQLCREMAKISIKARRLDIALKCIEKLKMPKLQAALRTAEHQADAVKLAFAAIHLGIDDEVEPLYRSCGRADLLEAWLQANGRWDEALQVAERAGRHHALHSHYTYGLYLENAGDYSSALNHLQLSRATPCNLSNTTTSSGCPISESGFGSVPERPLVSAQSVSGFASTVSAEEATSTSSPTESSLRHKATMATGLRCESPRILRLAEMTGDVEAFLRRQADPQLYRWQGFRIEKQAWEAEQETVASSGVSERHKRSLVTSKQDGVASVPQGSSVDPTNTLAGAKLSNQLDKLGPQARRKEALLKQALMWYSRGNLHSHKVRVLCSMDQIDEARKVCGETGDQEACLVLAHELEKRGEVREAVKLYTNAGKLRKALSLGHHEELDSDLMAAALNASPEDLVAAATCLYERQEYEKAVALFRKAGQLDTALQVCLAANLRDSLRLLAEEATPSNDHSVIEKCAAVFVEAGLIDRAVQLLAKTKHFDSALQVCESRDLSLSDSLVNALTPSKEDARTALEARRAVLVRLGKICLRQKLFHLACRSFTAAAEIVAAVDCLIKTGDTDKIIYFANTARHPDVYISAANYLQGLDHFSDEKLRNSIVSFYQKAKAFPKLAAFYINVAQVKIEEHSAYEQALAALQESRNYLVQCPDAEKKIDLLDVRIDIITRYIEATRLRAEDPDAMVRELVSLLKTPAAEKVLNIGDVFSDLGRHYNSIGNFAAVRLLIKKMQERNLQVPPYLLQERIENACDNTGCAIDARGFSDHHETPLCEVGAPSQWREGAPRHQDASHELCQGFDERSSVAAFMSDFEEPVRHTEDDGLPDGPVDSDWEDARTVEMR
ncbi:UNVERIFIED_CONTAM: tetratricopeptide repeat-containing protein [Hammondia hammondi]|eukprot:XP_008886677.1 tetratricopeptide repeat-containing protein [Hammondia hammondi]